MGITWNNHLKIQNRTTEWKTNSTEPQHDKTNKMSVRPAETQISLGICPV